MDLEDPSAHFEEGFTSLPHNLQKESVVGGPVTCASFDPLSDNDDMYVFLARGPFLEHCPLNHRGKQGMAKVRRCVAFPSGGTVHGIRYESNFCVVFGGRQVAIFRNERRQPLSPLAIIDGFSETPPGSLARESSCGSISEGSMMSLGLSDVFSGGSGHARRLTPPTKKEKTIQEEDTEDSIWLENMGSAPSMKDLNLKSTSPPTLPLDKFSFSLLGMSDRTLPAKDDLQGQHTEPSFSLTLSDWIWDIRLQPQSSGQHLSDPPSRTNHQNVEFLLVAGMAQNSCDIWRACVSRDPSSRREVIRVARLKHVACEVRCITYCMSFFGREQETLMIAAGTVFNEILIWTPFEEEDRSQILKSKKSPPTIICKTPSRSIHRPVQYRLVGHEGVIHAVTVLQKRDGPTFIASTSDDRTVRLWRQDMVENDEPESFVLQWTGYGHTARVWDVAFSPQVEVIVSAGEDGTARVWDMPDGKQLAELRGSGGSISLWKTNTFDSLVVAGCNDGTAKIWNLKNHMDISKDGRILHKGGQFKTGPSRYSCCVPKDPVIENIDSGTDMELNRDGEKEDESPSTGSNKSKKKKKKSKQKSTGQVVFRVSLYRCSGEYAPERLLVATRAGSLFSYNLNDKEWTEMEPWRIGSSLDDSSGFKGTEGSCMAVNKAGNMVALGTTRGDVVLMPLASRCEKALEESVATSKMILAAAEYKCTQGVVWKDDSTLVTFQIKGVAIVWHLSSTPTHDLSQISALRRVFNMGTLGIPLCFAIDEDEKHFFTGDSRGNIAMFDFWTPFEEPHEKERSPIELVPRAHKKEHVTDIVCCSGNRVISVGNDGCVRECLTHVSGTARKALYVPAASLSGMSKIWLASNDDGDETIIVGGYYGNEFVVVDVTRGYELFRVDTGGRQRQQDCFFDLRSSISNDFPLAYHVAILCQKDGENEVSFQSDLPPGLQSVSPTKHTLDLKYSLGVGMHSETIFDACFCETKSNGLLLLSGSEDCAAKLSKYENGTLVSSKYLQPHVTCVRAVCCSRGIYSEKSLLVTCGGKLSVEFYVLDHGQGESVYFLGSGNFPSKVDIDHRVNAVKAIPLLSATNDKRSVHLVAVGDSNGRVCLFCISEDPGVEGSSMACHVLHEGPRPILCIDILRIRQKLLLVAGTTGGDVLVWDLPGDNSTWGAFSKEPLFRYDAHQMGTNCLSATVWAAEQGSSSAAILICSGGDDQVIVTCRANIHIEEAGMCSMEIVNKTALQEASISAIKGISMVGNDHILTVGYGQRLALWKIQGKMNDLKLLSSAPVDVADVNCLAYGACHDTRAGGIGQDIVACAGEGIEFFSF